MEHLRATIREVMGGEMKIEPHERLFDLGLDSLMALEVKNHLESNLKQPLRSTLLFNYPTLEKLTEYLLNDVLEIKPDLEAQQALSAQTAEEEEVENQRATLASPDDLSNWDSLSQDEIADLLLEELMDNEDL